MDHGPWSVKGALLSLQPWPSELTLAEIDFSTILFWIQVHNLPRNRMNLDTALKIGNYAGQFLSTDNTAPYQITRKFMRIRVAVNTAQPLKAGCFILRDDGTRSWISFKYERLSDFCYNCGHVNHTIYACSIEQTTAQHQSNGIQAFGDWMRTKSSSTGPPQRSFPPARPLPVVRTPVTDFPHESTSTGTKPDPSNLPFTSDTTHCTSLQTARPHLQDIINFNLKPLPFPRQTTHNPSPPKLPRPTPQPTSASHPNSTP